jgi:hypothetical protein
VAVLYARQVAAEKTGAFFNVPLGHASLEPETANGLTDIHKHATCSIPRLDAKPDCKKRFVHSNQTGTFWQVEIPGIDVSVFIRRNRQRF